MMGPLLQSGQLNTWALAMVTQYVSSSFLSEMLKLFSDGKFMPVSMSNGEIVQSQVPLSFFPSSLLTWWVTSESLWLDPKAFLSMSFTNTISSSEQPMLYLMEKSATVRNTGNANFWYWWSFDDVTLEVSDYSRIWLSLNLSSSIVSNFEPDLWLACFASELELGLLRVVGW